MLRVAIVGCGKIADGHVEQVRATGMADVVAVCDREPLMAQQLALRMQVSGTYADMAEMLERERPDVVHIATPPDSHLAVATMCLQAGCHVFLEKPFALDAAQTRLILDRATSAGKRVSVNYLYNFESPYLELMQQVNAGALGKVLHLDVVYGYNLGGDYGMAVLADPEHWVHKLPGKLFHNVLDHVIAKAAPFIGSEPFLAKTQVRRLRPTSGQPALDAMPDELRFLLQAGDVSISGLISAHIRPVQHSVKVFGTMGSVVVDIGARTCVPVVAQTLPSAVGRLVPAWLQSRHYRRSAWANVRLFRRHEFHFFQGMRVLLGQFYGAIQGKNDDPLTHHAILRTAEGIDALLHDIRASGGEAQS
jgi:predicted dehydrogenase